jgi:N-carbamoylputrescine amidase
VRPALQLHGDREVQGIAAPGADEGEDRREGQKPDPLDERCCAASAYRGAAWRDDGRVGGNGGLDHAPSMRVGRANRPRRRVVAVCQLRYKPVAAESVRPGWVARPEGGVPSPSITLRTDATERDPTMPRIVRGALVQASWTGDKESMIQKHEERAHEAAKQGTQVILFQELFYGPYFCQVQDAQYYSYTELIPDGPTTKRMQDLAKQTGMVVVAPMYEEDAQASGIYYNTAAVIDADGTYLGKYRKTHIPHVKGFWEKFYFRPGNMGYPVFETAVGKVGVYICYDRHFPEGARALGLNGAEIVFIPSATSRGLSEYLWRIEQPSHAVANGYYVGTINRIGIEKEFGDDDFYGQSYFVDPRGQFVGDVGSADDEELIVRDLDLDKIAEVRNTWQFFRDRRPDAYADLTRP